MSTSQRNLKRQAVDYADEIGAGVGTVFAALTFGAVSKVTILPDFGTGGFASTADKVFGLGGEWLLGAGGGATAETATLTVAAFMAAAIPFLLLGANGLQELVMGASSRRNEDIVDRPVSAVAGGVSGVLPILHQKFYVLNDLSNGDPLVQVLMLLVYAVGVAIVAATEQL
jgi:hypothetical protein